MKSFLVLNAASDPFKKEFSIKGNTLFLKHSFIKQIKFSKMYVEYHIVIFKNLILLMQLFMILLYHSVKVKKYS